MKLQIKTTFDFGKLAKKMPKILEKHMQRTGRSSAQGAKEAISKGLSPPLKKSTIARRKYKVKVATGGYSQGGGTKPLFHTGTLFRDIKGTSEGLEMWDYGLHQHKGHKAGHFPPRPFIFPSEKAILKSFDAFRKDIRKGLKK